MASTQIENAIQIDNIINTYQATPGATDQTPGSKHFIARPENSDPNTKKLSEQQSTYIQLSSIY